MWKVSSHRYQDIDKDLFLRPQDIPTKKMAGSKEEKKNQTTWKDKGDCFTPIQHEVLDIFFLGLVFILFLIF